MATVPIVTSVTYAELVALIQASGLETGLQYELTFQTKHYILDYNGSLLAGSPTNIGSVEHLILIASSANTFDVIVKSIEYPQDIIYYDWNPANWLNDIAFSIDQTNIIDGFKGVITHREDTELQNAVGFDFRNVKSRRWKPNHATYSDATTYIDGDFVKTASGVFVSIVNGNLNNSVFDESKWIKLINFEYTQYWEVSSSSAENINDFIDCKLFEESTGGTYLECVKNNYFDSRKDNYSSFLGYCGSILNNSVIYLTDEGTITIYNNKVFGFFDANTIIRGFNNNLTLNGFSKNIISDTFANIVSYWCSNTNFAGSCSNSVILYSRSNKIGSGFLSNECNLDSSTINKNFQLNKGVLNSVNLGLATHVYGDYNCELVKTSTGTFKLKYVDGSDNTEKIVDATA